MQQPEPSASVVLYRVDRARRIYRFYRLDVQPDLFGAWCLMREWGRIGTQGRELSVPFSSPTEAERALRKHQRIKERRGYRSGGA